MATIDIRREHGLGLEAAREATEKVARRLEEKVQVRWHWDGDVLRLDRSGAKGTIAVTGADVHVQIELGMMLRPMKGSVEQKVQEYLARYLG